MKTLKTFGLIAIAGLAVSCANSNVATKVANKIDNPSNKVVLSKDVKLTPLNPARGKMSPMAGDLWGNRKEAVPTAFLLKFAENFSSPPHIHNISYRAVVIAGMAHNDDPKAENMWMPAGSFWTQPAGEPHITSAKGAGVTSIVEIDEGPYLVKPTSQAFDNGEKPINIDASNVVWLDASESTWIAAAGDTKISFLWQNKKTKQQSIFVKLPKNFKGKINSMGAAFHAAVIQGELNYQMPNQEQTLTLDPGSAFSSEGLAVHQIASNPNQATLLYISTNDKFKVIEERRSFN